MPKKIFISYVREDAQTANRLFSDLRRRGYDPWLDTESLLPGQDFKPTIRRAIKDSSSVLILISSKSVNKRGFFQAEVKEALAVFQEIPPGDVFLIPVRLDGSEPRYEELGRLHWVDLFPCYEDGFPKLVASLTAQEVESQGDIPRRLAGAHPFSKGEIRKLVNSGKFEQAVKAYNELIDGNPKAYPMFIGRAQALYLSGRLGEALLDLDEAERLAPGNSMVDAARQKMLAGDHPFSRGEIRKLLLSGKFEQAVEAFNKLINANPKAYPLFIGRAKALYGSGRLGEALLDLDEAERLEPGNPIADAVRQKILKNESFPGPRPPYEESIRRSATNRGNNALVRMDLEVARNHYDEAKAQGLNDATYAICLSMIGILKSEPQSARKALASFDHATAGPFMSVEIQAVKAFIALIDGQTPDLSELQAARRPLKQFDLYRTALGYLRAALANAKRASPETERIFEAMRYQED